MLGLVAILASVCASAGAFTAEDRATLRVDLRRVVTRVSDRYLSVAIDASLARDETFMRLLGSPKLRTLASALRPAFLRFGGTEGDFLTFSPGHRHPGTGCEGTELPPLLEDTLKTEWTLQAEMLREEELQRKYRRVNFTESAVDLLYAFSNCSGLDLIFGLNALLRTEQGSWDSRNAQLLLKYCESAEYSMSWELGNEPNSFESKAGFYVSGHQLGLDFTDLRNILQESKFYQSAGLYGPDIGQPRDRDHHHHHHHHHHHRSPYLLKGFLQRGAGAIDACTWHHYYVDGKTASLEDFLNPDVLDSLATVTNNVLKIVEDVSSGKKVWLGETSSAYGGGAVGLSNSFVAGFMWLDKLGLGAKLGLDVVIRQVLIGAGTYHLVDNSLNPLPDYWLSVLYKELVGTEVLDVSAVTSYGANRTLRVYCHCTNRRSTNYRRGAVTLFALNLNKRPVKMVLAPPVSNTTVEAFVLDAAEPGERGLYSSFVRLNGNLLKMVDDRTLPELRGKVLQKGEALSLPPYSFAFYVLGEAKAAACE
ncbi:heparanase [Denticeps clupeoides]|uniref:Heparanase n=1 Tax=Denticeps clupeoides TaxID=299321 RepID=A0AAY4BT03_9TELE|nr:heparanase [Denticeps clupeoides]